MTAISMKAAVLHETALVKIRKDTPLDRAALIGCADTTGFGAVVNTAQAARQCCGNNRLRNNTGIEWYRASCNSRRVLVVNRKQSAPYLNESRRPTSITKSATFSITVFAFVNNAG